MIKDPREPKDISLEGNSWDLPTELRIMDLCDEEISRRLQETKLTEEQKGFISLALREAIANAIVHGNLNIQSPKEEAVSYGVIAEKEKTCTKRVHINLEINEKEFMITIADEGDGFMHQQVADPLNKDALLRGSGRGIFLMHRAFDSVEYNEKGNEVTLRKNLP